MTNEDQAVIKTLNALLGAFWTGMAQHQAHLALLESWGLTGLAAEMAARTADEPVTIRRRSDRLLELDGEFDFAPAKPNIGKTLAEVLQNDMATQAVARPGLNQAAELMASRHDATTRNLIELILAGEEEHLDWLKTELDLFQRLGEALYVASRLDTGSAKMASTAPGQP